MYRRTVYNILASNTKLYFALRRHLKYATASVISCRLQTGGFSREAAAGHCDIRYVHRNRCCRTCASAIYIGAYTILRADQLHFYVGFSPKRIAIK